MGIAASGGSAVALHHTPCFVPNPPLPMDSRGACAELPMLRKGDTAAARPHHVQCQDSHGYSYLPQVAARPQGPGACTTENALVRLVEVEGRSTPTGWKQSGWIASKRRAD